MWFVLGYTCGIAGLFSLWFEPAYFWLWCCLGIGLLASIVLRKGFLLPLVLLSGSLVGFGWAGLRAHFVEAPKLFVSQTYDLTGTVFRADQSFSGAPRLWLSDVHLIGLSEPPARIRVSIPKDLEFIPSIGSRISVSAVLSAPMPKSDPNGYDFERAAWFLRLGGVGYARAPPVLIGTAPDTLRLKLDRFREGIGLFLKRHMKPRSAGFAQALMVGDRSDISPEDLDALRASNLAHLLAISGLHMGLLTALVFGTCRLSLLLTFSRMNARYIKKIAAFTALIAGLVYLALSGFGIATQRAFVMVGVMLVAILLDRPAISLRSLALAGLILLVLQPENLLHAGFQMSFAATSALVVGFEATRTWFQRRSSTLVREGGAIVLSSALAGAATAPVAAFHFNRLILFGLAANLCTVPLMGLVIIPSLILACLFTPLGFGFVFFHAAEIGIDWILTVAHFTSSRPNAIRWVQSAPEFVLGVIAFGWTFFILWKGQFKWVGALIVFLALYVWSMSSRPDILVSKRSGAVGVLTENGRVVNKARAARFEVTQWLDNDGLSLSQEASAASWPDRNPAQFGTNLLVYSGSRAPKHWLPCKADQIVIAPKLNFKLSGECLQITGQSFGPYETLTITYKKTGPIVRPASKTGRLWQRP
ncbi:MAG: ComEC/Rec2 family competence protein [Pseudomonadota bacterium]